MSDKSKFYIDIANELGLGYKKNRAVLLGTALGKPANYYNLRAHLVDVLTEKQVKEAYKMYWDILKLGILPNTTSPYKFKNGNDADVELVPDLPEHLINKFITHWVHTMYPSAPQTLQR